MAIQMEERKQQKKDKEKTTQEEGNIELDPEENTGVDQTDVDSEVTRGDRMEGEGETADDVVDGCDNDTDDRCTDGQTDECGTWIKESPSYLDPVFVWKKWWKGDAFKKEKQDVWCQIKF